MYVVLFAPGKELLVHGFDIIIDEFDRFAQGGTVLADGLDHSFENFQLLLGNLATRRPLNYLSALSFIFPKVPHLIFSRRLFLCCLVLVGIGGIILQIHRILDFLAVICSFDICLFGDLGSSSISIIIVDDLLLGAWWSWLYGWVTWFASLLG